MPHLTDAAIKRALPQSKTRRLFDTRGLYLEINPKGRKYWRFRYKFGQKEKRLSLGIYPEVTLKNARSERDAMRDALEGGRDPSQLRKLDKLAGELATERSFGNLTEHWRDKVRARMAESSLARDMRLLEVDILPLLKDRPAEEISPPELLTVLRGIEKRGAVYTAHRARALCGRILRYGVSIGWVDRDVSADLRGALREHKETHQAAVTTPAALASILKVMDGYSGTYVVQQALRLAPMLMVRPGELRHAEWTEIDLDEPMWRIPARKMKLRRDHLVPLPSQAVKVFRDLHELTGRRQWVFPGHRSPRRPMSENAVTAALRRMGLSGEEITGHGFRATASTLLHEQGWNPDVIEAAQARAVPGVRGTYNRAIYLKERKKMLQEWADYLDKLRDSK